MCVVTLNNYITGESPGGTWTQIVNPGNSTVAIVNGSINTDNINTGIYTFAYTVTNGTCTDTSTLTITVIPGGKLSTNTYCAVDASPTIYNIFTLSGVTSATHSLAYQAGSQQDVNINLITGNYLATEVGMGIYVIELIPIDPIIDECDCIRTHTIYSVGCVDVTLNVNNCEISWSPTCIQANTVPVVYTLQEFVNNNWVNLTTVSPYIIPAGQSKTLRLEAVASPCLPIYSPQVTVFCDPNMCTTCLLQFSQYGNNSVGRLSVGNVISSSNPACTVGNFVIDWYLNSVAPQNKVLVSGKGNDPDIEVQHPFNGNSAIPVIGGTYIPRIRYIYLNGVLYAPTTYPGALLSPALLTCLPNVIVQDYSCGNGGNAIIGQGYEHNITYSANTNFQNATRTIRFNYTPNVNLYLAYFFLGYTIADRIKFIHVLNNVDTVLLDMVVGTDNNGTDLNSTPKLIDRVSERNLLELPTQVGSYLRIEITPSYNAPGNQNTNWDLSLKCLNEFSCDEIITNPTVTCTSLGCTTTVTGQVSTNPYYFYIGSSINPTVSVTISNTYGCIPTLDQYSFFPCSQVPSGTMTKVGNTWTMQFGNATAYNAYKDSFDNVVQIGICNDNTIPPYYNGVQFSFHTANSCGDSTITRQYLFHRCTSTFTWNSGNNTLIIQTSSNPIVNNYVNLNPCDNCYNHINSFVITMNQVMATPDFSLIVQNILYTYPVIYTRFPASSTPAVYNPQYTSCGSFFNFTRELFPIANCICAINYTAYCLRMTVTDVNDPCNNYIFEAKEYTNSCVNDTWTVLLSEP